MHGSNAEYDPVSPSYWPASHILRLHRDQILQTSGGAELNAANMESLKGRHHLHKLNPQIIYQEAQNVAADDSNETYAKRQIASRPSIVTAAKSDSKDDDDYKLYNRQIQLELVDDHDPWRNQSKEPGKVGKTQQLSR